jgi:hypothetical protein
MSEDIVEQLNNSVIALRDFSSLLFKSYDFKFLGLTVFLFL